MQSEGWGLGLGGLGGFALRAVGGVADGGVGGCMVVVEVEDEGDVGLDGGVVGLDAGGSGGVVLVGDGICDGFGAGVDAEVEVEVESEEVSWSVEVLDMVDPRWQVRHLVWIRVVWGHNSKHR